MIQEILTNVGFFCLGYGIASFFAEKIEVGIVTYLIGFLLIIFGVR
jgi:hypothetical protein